MSGHSKWSQIKHKKALVDAKKGNTFSKLVHEITIAAKTGGGNSDSNIRLRAAVERARQEGVPKDNIERAMSRGSGGTQDNELKEFLFEATGPGGIAILIEGITDNTNRTVNEIKHMLRTHGGHMVQPGSLLWNFQKIGILEINAAQNSDKSKDDIELALIESGAQDFSFLENKWIVETGFADRERVSHFLENNDIVVNMSGVDFKAGNTIILEGQTSAAAQSLLNILVEHEDVQEVYTNMQE